MKNFVQDGNVVTVTITSTDGISAGAAVLLNNLFGIAAIDAAQNEETELAVVGVFTLPKKTTAPIDQGAAVFFDPSDGAVAAASSTGLAEIGIATESASTSVAEIDVRLNGVGTTAA